MERPRPGSCILGVGRRLRVTEHSSEQVKSREPGLGQAGVLGVGQRVPEKGGLLTATMQLTWMFTSFYRVKMRSNLKVSEELLS